MGARETLRHHAQANIPPALLEQARGMVAGGLTRVFVVMLVVVLALWAVTRLMPARACVHKVRASEAMDAA